MRVCVCVCVCVCVVPFSLKWEADLFFPPDSCGFLLPAASPRRACPIG